jgi:hypothetical protein
MPTPLQLIDAYCVAAPKSLPQAYAALESIEQACSRAEHKAARAIAASAISEKKLKSLAHFQEDVLPAIRAALGNATTPEYVPARATAPTEAPAGLPTPSTLSPAQLLYRFRHQLNPEERAPFLAAHGPAMRSAMKDLSGSDKVEAIFAFNAAEKEAKK